MKTKTKVLYALAVSLLLLCMSSMNAIGGQTGPPSKKLGYGFERGLVAGKDYVSRQLVVGLKGGVNVNSIIQTASVLGGQVAKKIDNSAVLLQFSSDAAVEAVANKLILRTDVLFIERNGYMSIPPKPELQFPARLKSVPINGMKQNAVPKGIIAQSVSTDPGTGYQWHQTVIRKTAALPILSLTPPTVAVIDTGVDYTHPDLSGKVILGLNVVANNYDPYDDYGHGTHVAGIIAGRAANGSYGEGVCSNCKILAVKVLGADGSGNDFDVALGMAYARTVVTSPPTKIINMSLGGTSSSALISAQVNLIKAAGKVLVVSAGNSNSSVSPHYPAAYPNTALRVMSTETNDCRSYFSNFSPSSNPLLYNIAAPGSDIMSTTSNAGYESYSGTSMASPVVAGSAALVWGQLPALTRDALVSRMLTMGQPVSCGFAVATKRVDVRKAILGTSEVAIIGRILDPFTGKPPSRSTLPTNASLMLGATVLGANGTNTGGSYAITGLTVGTGRVLKGVHSGYVSAALRTGITIAGGVAGPFTDALPTLRPTGNATVTLDWRSVEPIFNTTGCGDACQGSELDLYVKLPSGYYIGYSYSGDLAGTPFVKFPRDSYNDLKAMETIVIGSGAANGVYKVFADKPNYTFGWKHSWTGSGASVQLFNGPASIGSFYANPPAVCGTNEFWHVANLTKTGTAYTVSNVNTCSNIYP
ncbi:MAG: S8 family serine peptidase [Methylococcaceae bacterium]